MSLIMTLTDITASQSLPNGADDVVTNDITDDAKVFGSKRVLVHKSIHCWKDVGGRSRCQSSKKGSLEDNTLIEHSKKSREHTARLSHRPCAILDSVLAEHGAMRTISAHLRSSMCKIGSPILYLPCSDPHSKPFSRSCRHGKPNNTHRPLVFVCPYLGIYIFYMEKFQRSLRCYDLNFNLLILINSDLNQRRIGEI